MHHKVIIIGAGVSGLACAKTFLDNGFEDFLILEAKDKCGGRIETKYLNENSPIELGAQWIHGQDNDFYRFMEKCGQVHPERSWEGEGEFRTPQGLVADKSTVQKVTNWINESLNEVEENYSIEDYIPTKDSTISVGSYLQKKFTDEFRHKNGQNGESFEILEAIFQWGMSFQRIDNCCNYMTDLSLYRWGEFEINGGKDYNNFLLGAQNFIDEFLMPIPLMKSRILLNSPVCKIGWSDEKLAKIQTTNGLEYNAQVIVITCSFGFLKAEKDNLFDPHLPQILSKAIDSTGYGPLTKIYLQWDKPWWTIEDFRGYQFLWPKEWIDCCNPPSTENYELKETYFKNNWFKAITGFDPVLENPNVLLAWMGGPEAVYVEKHLTKEEIGSKCCEILEKFTGINVPQIKDIFVSQWNSDKYFQGAYCYRSTLSDKIPQVTNILCQPVMHANSSRPILIFAGEALHYSRYSTLHGAFENGVTQGKKVLKYFKNGHT